MNKKFIKRVMHDGCVYTRKYCYVFREGTWRWWASLTSTRGRGSSASNIGR